MSIGELLDRTFVLYKRHFLLFMGIAAPAPTIFYLIVLLYAALDSLSSRGAVGAGASTGYNLALDIAGGAVLIVGAVAILLSFVLAHAATIRAVSSVHLSKPMTIRGAYRELKGHYRRIVGIFLSVGIRMLGGSLLIYVGTSASTVGLVFGARYLGTVGPYVALIAAIICIVGGLLLMLTLFVRYSMAIPACVMEDIPGKQAIKRSVFLAKGNRSRILTIYVLFSVISNAIWGCFAIPAAIVSSLHSGGQLSAALQVLAFSMAMLMAMPLATLAISLEYYDERVRKEGFDLEILVASLQPAQAPTPVS